jgi:hypothetical protein
MQTLFCDGFSVNMHIQLFLWPEPSNNTKSLVTKNLCTALLPLCQVMKMVFKIKSSKDFVVTILSTCVWNLSCGLSYFETPNK